jgi:hypothetical protein
MTLPPINLVGQKKTQRPLTESLRFLFFAAGFYQLLILRIRVFSRLLVRAALFLWIRPLLTMVSILGLAALSSAPASSALPSSAALRTPLIAVRMRERSATLCWRFFSAWRARFADCLVFATRISSVIERRICRSGKARILGICTPDVNINNHLGGCSLLLDYCRAASGRVLMPAGGVTG